MGGTQTVPMFAPDGTLGDIPYERMMDAMKAGAKPAVTMRAPDGSTGLIPADRMQDAVKAGGTVVPLKDQEAQHPGFWHALYSDLSGLLHPAGVSPYPGMDQETKSAMASDAAQQDQSRKAAGYSAPYRALAPVAQSVGVNVPGMEQSAAQGDVAGVAGHAASVPAVMAAAAGVRTVAPRIANTLAERAPEMYKSALKPSTTISPSRTASMINTGLSEEIPVSKGGLEKLGTLIDDVNAKIKAEIATDPNRTISKGKVVQRLNDVVDQFSNQVNPKADLNAIADSGQEFIEGQPSDIPAAQAQKLKQGTYQQLKARSYGELKSATIESQKALARGLKEEIASAFPEIDKLNAQDSKLYALEPVLERAVQRIGNHQLIGIGTPIAAGAAEAVTGSSGAGAIAGAIKAVVDNPLVKSKLAIRLAKGANISPATAMNRVNSYLESLAVSSASNEPRADRQN